MNFGIITECYVREGKDHTLAFDDTFEQVAAAEQLGLDSVWVVEQHFRPWASILPSPMVMAAAIAARTARLRVGLAVQVLPLNNPLRIAEEAAMVDHISHGRFDFGVGRSGIPKFYDGYNIPYSESRERFSEALEVILRAFTLETFSFTGRFFNFRDVTLAPKPLQKPHPPVHIAVSHPENLPELGRRGFPALLWYNSGAFHEKEILGYRQSWREAGHPGQGQISVRVAAYVGETPAKARNEPRDSALHDLRRSAREYRQMNQEDRAANAERLLGNYDEVLRTRAMFGSPEEVVERLIEFQERMTADGVLLDLNYGGQIPQELVLNSMRLLADRVVPAFR